MGGAGLRKAFKTACAERLLERLFSYGTLRLPRVQEEIFGRRLRGRRDGLSGYARIEVRIRDPEVIRKSGKNIHPGLRFTGHPGDTVEGFIFEISPEELRRADAYEVKDYTRIRARFRSGAVAWVYVIAGVGDAPGAGGAVAPEEAGEPL